MNGKISDVYKVQADIIKAFSHPARIFMVKKLAEKDICVCHLAKKTGSAVSTVSKHLNILKTAGIVVTKKHKNNIYYSLKCRCVLDFLDCAGKVLKSCISEKMKLIKKE